MCVLVRGRVICIIVITERVMLSEYIKEVIAMALSNLAGWVENVAVSACGAGDKPEEKPAACGSACGAGDK